MKLFDRIRAHARTHGFACDACGAELFDYYPRRLCDECLNALSKNDGRTCPKCGRKTVSAGVCLTCKSHAPKFTKAFSPFVYEGEVAQLINRVKKGQRRLCFFLGESIADTFVRDMRIWEEAGVYGFKPEDALIVYAPIAPKRLRARGFNQAKELALAFCERLGEEGYVVPVAKEVITLNKVLLQQKELRIQERAKNVRGAFHVARRKEVKGKVILLVDDVMTTGATGDECAQMLLRAGARAVLFFTVASAKEEAKKGKVYGKETV